MIRRVFASLVVMGIGGPGDDLFLPVNTPTAVKDIIHCGGGYDVAYVDSADKTFDDCERVVEGVPSPR